MSDIKSANAFTANIYYDTVYIVSNLSLKEQYREHTASRAENVGGILTAYYGSI